MVARPLYRSPTASRFQGMNKPRQTRRNARWEVYWHGRWQSVSPWLAAWYVGIRAPVRLV